MARGKPFQPGAPRLPNAGRKKGTPNKKTLKLIEIMDELKYDPARALIELLPELDPKDKAFVHVKLMEYKYPKRRPEDADGDPENPINLPPAQFTPEQMAEFIKVARGAK